MKKAKTQLRFGNIEFKPRDIFFLRLIAEHGLADLGSAQLIYQGYYYERTRELEADGFIFKKKGQYCTLGRKGRKVLSSMGYTETAWKNGNAVTINRRRSMTVALSMLWLAGVKVLHDEYMNACPDDIFFIPSQAIKKYGHDIDRSSRFLGILYSHGGNFAVYRIGTGKFIWHTRTEETVMNFRLPSQPDRNIDGPLLIADTSEAVKLVKTAVDNKQEKSKESASRFAMYPVTITNRSFDRCPVIIKNESGINLLKIITTKNWREKILFNIIDRTAAIRSTWKHADCRYKDGYIVNLMDFDMIRLSHVETFLLLNPPTLEYEDKYNTLKVYILCLEGQSEMLSERLPAADIVPFDMKAVLGMLEDTTKDKTAIRECE